MARLLILKENLQWVKITQITFDIEEQKGYNFLLEYN